MRTRCNGTCVNFQSDPENCNGCGNVCSAVPFSVGICVNGECEVSCSTARHLCGTSCVLDHDVATCGTRCTACPQPRNAVATCDGVECGFECIEDGVIVDGACVLVPPPRALAPLSTATVSSRRPTLRWNLVGETTGAHVEICRDRACSNLIERFDATGSSGRPTENLPAGVVFWRLRGRAGAVTGETTSQTWQFTVGARSASTIDTSHGTTVDVNGDGWEI
jgi:hypothetical protein